MSMTNSLTTFVSLVELVFCCVFDALKVKPYSGLIIAIGRISVINSTKDDVYGLDGNISCDGFCADRTY